MNFDNIEYLKSGNAKQRKAYCVLTEHQVLSKLSSYNPILVGTIPINIDIETSDLDIICHVTNRQAFAALLKQLFSDALHFKLSDNRPDGSIVASFVVDGFAIEIFGQDIPVKQQMAYRHMLIEYRLLQEHGEPFRQQIIALKRQGHKTEPAFGIALGLQGNPYEALLMDE